MTLGEFRKLTAELPEETPLVTYGWSASGYHFDEAGANIRIAKTEGHKFDPFPANTTVVIVEEWDG